MEKTEKKGLGRAIRVIRTELGLSRRNLEERTRLSYPYLSEIEAGKKIPSPVALQAITNALEVPEEELLERARHIEQGRGGPLAKRHFHQPADESSPMQASSLKASPGPTSSDPLEELIHLAGRLSPDDLQRLIDLAQRLQR